MLRRRELEPVFALDVDLHGVAARDLPAQQMLRQLVFDSVRDHAPQRTRAVDPVVSLFGQQVLGRVGDLNRYLLLNQVLAELRELQIDDLPDLPGGQALEDDHGVDTVEKLRPEHTLELFVDLFLGVLVATLDLVRLVNDGRLETERGAAWLTSRMPRFEVM